MNDNDRIEQIFLSLRAHVLSQITSLPQDADGCVVCSGPQLGITILAAALQLCAELACDEKDIRSCIDTVLAPKLVLS